MKGQIEADTVADWIGGQKSVTPALANKIAEQPDLLPGVLAGIEEPQAKVKFGCLKALMLLSLTFPALLEPYRERFIRLLDSDNNIFKWNAMQILAHLATVEPDSQFEAIFDQYFAPILGPTMITAGHAMSGGATVAAAKPRLAPRIAGEILKVRRARYKTDECKNIAIGHAIKALSQFYDQLDDKKPILRFVQEQTGNSRNATKQKALQFLKKHVAS